jgi:lipopolysaccharide export system protein LptA
MSNRIITVLSGVITVIASITAGAASNCEEPVNINADFSDTSLSDGQTVLRGNVIITQCELEIRADEALIFTAERQIQRVELTGQPVHINQNSDALGRVNATSDAVDYDVQAAVMIFTGNANIVYSQGEVTGDQIRYEILNDRFQGGGDDGDGRIQIRLEAPGLPNGEAAANPEDS